MRLAILVLFSMVLSVTSAQYDDLVCRPQHSHPCREPAWQLVFKAVSGVAQPTETDLLLSDPYEVWTRDAPYNEDIPAARHLNTIFQGHYKSSFVLNWERRNIKEVKVALLNDAGIELISLVFDGEGSDSMNWFSKARLLSSPWDDMFMEEHNFFSVIGGGGQRRWFINEGYGGCSGDTGWLVASGRLTGNCAWENEGDPRPVFLYSKEKTYINWNSEASVGEASIFAIFVKTKSRY